MLPFTLLGGPYLEALGQSASGSDSRIAITTGHLILALGGLFLLNLLLRVFYIRYDFVNGDEGVRALTAVRMLEGARLYVDVMTDKPPGASLFYAAVFAAFGRSMRAVHLAATVWNFGTALIVYFTGSRFYTRRVGLWAALLFVYFSTNYFTQDMMAANTELLMLPPYAAAFYFFMVARKRNDEGGNGPRSGSARLVAAGLLTGVAALFKQVGVLNLLFFGLYEALSVWKERGKRLEDGTCLWAYIRSSVARLSLIAVGFVVVLAGFVLWLSSMGALDDFWRNGVVLNKSYSDSVPFALRVKFMFGRGLGYVFFNAVLWAFAGWAVLRSVRDREGDQNSPKVRFEIATALWCAASLGGVMMGGRFFGHYFIPALPALSLLGARGLGFLAEALKRPVARRGAQLSVGVLALLFSIGLVRSHHRTAILAYETLTGARTHWSADWGMTKREQEAEIVSQYVRERVPAGEPLYIWGYAHDVFWRTGCRPASRYLTPYYIDGRFPDAEGMVPISGEELRREAAVNLVEDLRRSKPRLILDVEGGFNALPHPELVRYLKRNYRVAGSAGPDPARPFLAFELKD